MEGNRSCVVSLALVLMMVMIVAAQTHESQALDMDVHPTAFTGQCLKKCGLKCGLFIIKPPAFALCFTPCMAACKFLPSHALSSCTANCANSRLIYASPDKFLLSQFSWFLIRSIFLDHPSSCVNGPPKCIGQSDHRFCDKCLVAE